MACTGLAALVAMLAMASGCRSIFGFDDAYPIDSDGPIDTCTTQGVTCTTGTATAVLCGGQCWVSCTEPVVEAIAAAECVTWGGKLAPLRTASDQVCLRQNVVPTGEVWIGFEQMAVFKAPVDSGWSWNSDGLLVTLTNWAPTEPDDLDYNESSDEDCAYIGNVNDTWDDTSCTNAFPFACSRVED